MSALPSRRDIRQDYLRNIWGGIVHSEVSTSLDAVIPQGSVKAAIWAGIVHSDGPVKSNRINWMVVTLIAVLAVLVTILTKQC